ncbi:MAG: outer membrane lipoprotein carrier protein LolA [Flavitalea sp.]
MHKLIWLLLILASRLPLSAQYPGYTLLPDLSLFKEQLSSAAKNTNSIKSDFVQEKTLSMLSEKIISKGKFWFRKNNQVRMEYIHPFQYLMIINGDKVLIKDGQKQNTISVKSNKLFQQINKITVDCVQGTFLNNTDFKTRIFESKNNYLIELSPVSKALKDYFKTINVVVDSKNYSIITIEMNENSGDDTLIRFTNKELNSTIPDATFTID